MTHTPVRTRMAPSPTGEIHVGSMATLLKNYAFAKKHGGQFLLRIEDTDQERLVPGAVDRILQVIHDYGLDWDEGPKKGGPLGPYVQSERLDVYQEHVTQLLQTGKAYYCFCTKDRLEAIRDRQRAAKQPPKYDKHCRGIDPRVAAQRARSEPHVVRLAVPENESIVFTDLIRGSISFNSSEVDDQVLLKSDGFPTYHLAVVVDDHLMQVSHVLRGEEWISSTPKHVLLSKAFGWESPVYAHIPVFLNPDGKGKMSKRKGTVSAQSFLDRGYLPEALLNFFMILGWSPQDQREILTLDEYIREFDPSDVSPKSVVFDLQKLDWMNGVYIRKLSLQALMQKISRFLPADFPQEKGAEILPLVHERLVTLADIESLTEFFFRPVSHQQTDLLKKGTPELVAEQLTHTHAALENCEWTHVALESVIRKLQEQHDWKKKQYFMMLRQAFTGRAFTPPLFETVAVLERDTALERLRTARACVLT